MVLLHIAGSFTIVKSWCKHLMYIAMFATTCLKAPWCTQMNSTRGKKNPITLFSLIVQPASFVLMTGELDVGQTIGNAVNSRITKGNLLCDFFFFHSLWMYLQAPTYLLNVPKAGKSHWGESTKKTQKTNQKKPQNKQPSKKKTNKKTPDQVETQIFPCTVTFSTAGDNSRLTMSTRRAVTFSEQKTNPG